MAVLCALIVLCCPGESRAGEPPYAGQLRQSAERLRQKAQELPSHVDTLKDAVTAATNSVNAVRGELSEAGLPAPVYADFLDNAVRAIRGSKAPEDVRQGMENVALRLDAMAAGVPSEDAQVRSHTGVENVRAILNKELEGRAYSHDDDMRGAWFNLVLARIGKWWDRFINPDILERLQRGSFLIMISLLAVTTCALLLFYVRRFAMRRGLRAGREDQTVVHTRTMAHPDEYRLEAERHAAAGRYRDALRAQFLRILAELEGRKLVAYDRTRTNGEYVHQLRGRLGANELVRIFSALTLRYNAAWYGHEACTAQTYSDFNRGAAQAVHLAQAVQ